MARVKKANVTFKLNKDDVAFLDKLAESSDRDRRYLIRQAIGEFIATQKWQLEEVEAAIAEADRGEFLTDEEFRAEVQSWDNG